MFKLHLKILKQGRENILSTIERLSIQQLNTICENNNNNILWQIAHLIVTTDLLLYKLSKLENHYPDSFIDSFRKGTAPNREYKQSEFEQWKCDLMSQIDKIEEDMSKNKFVHYIAYPNSFGITLHSFKEALTFNCVHEAIHFGDIRSICRRL